MYYRGANAALLLYDITNGSSFDSVRDWIGGLSPFIHPPSSTVQQFDRDTDREFMQT
jgi:GTPase SAR1 family protein